MRRAVPTPTPIPMPIATFMLLPLLYELEAELIVVLAGAKVVGVMVEDGFNKEDNLIDEDDVVIDEGTVDAEADGRVTLKRLDWITVPLATDATIPAAVS
jgi:hypothetical protein